jgi:release factor glutamine methyltransferase
LARGFETVVGTDVVSVAQAVESKDGSEAILADRATCFRDGIFDLVAFNPPYLPSAGIEDRAVDGGRGGLEVPLAFLEEALRVSKADAPIVLLLSSESDLEEFARRAGELGLSVAEKARKELFFETLFVYEVRKRRAPGAPRPGR